MRATSVAATEIDGTTIYTALGIPVEHFGAKFNKIYIY